MKNAMNSNMLSVQSDCPHREKIQYGGDIIADSPAALHFYDMSAFYRKVESDDPDYYLMDHSTLTYLVTPEEGFITFFRRDMTAEAMAERVSCIVANV